MTTNVAENQDSLAGDIARAIAQSIHTDSVVDLDLRFCDRGTADDAIACADGYEDSAEIAAGRKYDVLDVWGANDAGEWRLSIRLSRVI